MFLIFYQACLVFFFIGYLISKCIRVDLLHHCWRRRTWRTTVWQSLPLLASDTFGPLAPGYSQYQEQGPCWGWGVLRSQVHSCGTVYQLPCKQQLSPHWRSLDIWRPICSADRQRIWGPFMTCSTNLLIIIIIITGLCAANCQSICIILHFYKWKPFLLTGNITEEKYH